MNGSSSSSSKEGGDQSIWELLNLIEIKLIDSIHQLTPQVIDTSQLVYDHLNSFSQSIYHQTNHLIEHLQSLSISSSSSAAAAASPASILNHQNLLLTNYPIQSSATLSNDPSSNRYLTLVWLPIKNLLKPRNLIITIGLAISSKWAFDLIVNSDHFDRFLRSHPSIRNHLRKPSSRRRKNQQEDLQLKRIKKKIIIILGANPASIGHQIALHLVQLGYIVIASVDQADSVLPLETEGLGWIKALVLDPLVPQSTRAFNRSLAASLSLRFPLNSSGDVFHNENVDHVFQSSLLGLINCLPISFPDDLRPVEAIQADDHLISRFNALTSVSLEVVKLVLPMIRNSISRLGATDGVILTLFPTKTSSVPLPYLGPSMIANQALETLMTTLRREMMISDSDNKRTIRIINEKIGSFRPSTHFSPSPIGNRPPSLPIHLHPIYAASLSRRVAFLNFPIMGGCLPILSTTGNPLSHLIKRVENIIQSPSIRSGSNVATGKEVWKYRFISSIVPERLIEVWLRFVERVNGWVRKKVASDVDLESQEALERVIEKRNFSAQSDWKANLFSYPPGPKLDDMEVRKDGQPFQEEGDPKGQSKSAEGQEDHDLAPSAEDDKEIELVAEDTGSVIDKGEAHEDPDSLDSSQAGEHDMKDSFVGSEIDWKENLDKSN